MKKLSELFTIVADRAGKVWRITPPEKHDMDDLLRMQRVTEMLPRVFDVSASEARTDHLDITDAPTLRMKATPPTSPWFQEET